MKSCKSDLNPGQNISGISVAAGGLKIPLGSALGGLIDLIQVPVQRTQPG